MVAYCPRETFSRPLISEGSNMLLGLHFEWMLDTAIFLGNPPCALGCACHICLPTLTVTAAEQTSSPWLPLSSRVSLVNNNNNNDDNNNDNNLEAFPVSFVNHLLGWGGGCLSEKFSIFYKQLICLLKLVSCYTPNRDHNSL